MESAETTKTRLEERLAALTNRTARIEAHLRKPGDRDWAERATETENDEVLERLGEAELSEIEEIRNALSRIENGTYGVCGRCEGPIDERRLAALPGTSLCIRCAE